MKSSIPANGNTSQPASAMHRAASDRRDMSSYYNRHDAHALPTSSRARARGDGELSLVMDYVHGATLAHLMEAQGGPVPPAIAVAIVAGVLHGLHAAHES